MEEKKYLWMADVSGIQDFIFSTPKLKEVIGASYLIQEIIGKAIEEVITEEYLENKGLAKEEIYIGGGNALLVLRDKKRINNFDDVFHEINKNLQLYFTRNTHSLKVITEYTEALESYSDTFQKLQKKLSQRKKQEVRQKTFDSESIFSRTAATGSGVVPAKERWSKESTKKIDSYKKWKNKAKDESEDNIYMAINKIIVDEGFEQSSEFDDFTTKNADSYLGIVHIDGNNMGKMIKELIEEKEQEVSKSADVSAESFEKLLKFHRKISQDINTKFCESMKEGLKEFIKNYHKENNSENTSTVFPFRQIIFAGDDITFVIRGDLAIPFTEIVIKEIAGRKIQGKPLSACGGIAFVRSHFPFLKAYEISEGVCSKAKKKIRDSEQLLQENLSALDMFYHYKGYSTDVESLQRKVLPNVVDEQKPFIIDDQKTYNELFTLKQLKDYIKELKTKGWKRSHLKKLRESLYLDETNFNKFVEDRKNRGQELPKLPSEIKEKSVLYPEKVEFLFRVLEQYDYLEGVKA